MIKKTIKNAWEWFDWNMFKAVSGFTETELDNMTEQVARFERRVYDIFVLMFMFFCFTLAAAVMYEGMSYTALSFVPPNFIQFTPLIMMCMLTFLMGYAGKLRGIVYERFAGKGNK